MANPSPIDRLLRLVPDQPERVLADLAATPALATAADDYGYTLLHAAASYTQLDLLRALVNTYHADVNAADPEGETALFYAETLAAAQCLVEELGADETHKNNEEFSATENAQANFEDGDGGEWGAVATYLAARSRSRGGAAAEGPAANGGANGTAVAEDDDDNDDDDDDLHAPPPLPPGVNISMGTVQEVNGDEDEADAPDPEFRRRIEELAARDDFQSERGQAELRNLVAEAIGGMSMRTMTDGVQSKSRRTD